LAADDIVGGKLIAIADDRIHDRIDMLAGCIRVTQTEHVPEFM
jgi:hypothetical protein